MVKIYRWNVNEEIFNVGGRMLLDARGVVVVRENEEFGKKRRKVIEEL